MMINSKQEHFFLMKKKLWKHLPLLLQTAVASRVFSHISRWNNPNSWVKLRLGKIQVKVALDFFATPGSLHFNLLSILKNTSASGAINTEHWCCSLSTVTAQTLASFSVTCVVEQVFTSWGCIARGAESILTSSSWLQNVWFLSLSITVPHFWLPTALNLSLSVTWRPSAAEQGSLWNLLQPWDAAVTRQFPYTGATNRSESEE